MNLPKNLVILYHAGTGGNHLANLIALSNRYYRHVDYSKYEYNGHLGVSNAHFQITNLSNTKKTNIFVDHFFEYYTKQINHNNQYIVIQLPKCNIDSLAFKRMCKFNHWTYDHTFPGGAYWDLDCLYKQQTLSKLIPSCHWDTIDSELLFSSDIDQLINDIEKKLNVEIKNKDLARSIHTKWISKLSTD